MKNKLLACMAFVLLFGILSTSCNDTEKNAGDSDAEQSVTTVGSESESEELPLIIADNGNTDYTLVYSSELGESVIQKIQTLMDTVSSKTDVELPVKVLSEGEAYDGNGPAIRIGKSACGDTDRNIGINDYIIYVSNGDLLINAHNDTNLEKAIVYAYQKLIPKNSTEGIFSLPNDYEYLRKAEYVYEEMTILNTDVSEFRVVIPEKPASFEKYAAVQICNYLSSTTGSIIELVTDKESPTEHEILIGQTNRYEKSLADGEYVMGSLNGSLYFIATDVYSYGEMADRVTEKLLFSSGKKVELSELPETVCNVSETLAPMQQNSYGEYRVLFNNILGNCDQELYPVAQRNQILADLYKTYDPDVIGLQECSANSRSTDKNSIIKLLEAQGYKEVPVTGCSSNLYVPVLYKADKFELLESGYQLYTLNAKKDNSKSLVYAVLKNKTTNETFAVISTHFTVYGDAANPVERARVGNATELLGVISDIYSKYGCPVVIGGDLNCNISSEAMKLLAKTGTDARAAAPVTDTTKTSHAYPVYDAELGIYVEYSTPKANAAEESIDHIYFYNSEDVTVNAFDVCADKYACLGTDHCPLVVDFTIS